MRLRAWPALLLVCACAPAPNVAQHEFFALGSPASITTLGADATGARTLSAIESELQTLGREWYPWSADGELKRLNAALAAGQTFSATPALVDLLLAARAAFEASDGAFDPAVAPMVEHWGFQDLAQETKHRVDAETLTHWTEHRVTLADLRIDGPALSSARRDLMLDLGAIGKGRAVDIAIDRLRAQGLQSALVNLGGNIRAIGAGPGGAWRIAVRHPRANRSLGWIDLRDGEGVATSGDYERFALVDGQRTHHLLDPRTGKPVMHTIAVTVLANHATLADAASTALFVAGPDRWTDVAKRLGVECVLRIDADGQAQISRALSPRLHVSDDTLRVRVVDL